jgi:DNA (cytosine-5)-methyltransferase 1
MVDVFCGAGGASLGLEDAGFAVKLAVDIDRKATDTYYLNNEDLSFDQVITCDLRLLDNRFLRRRVHEKIILVFGGPPCQGWSHIGKNRKNGSNGIDFLEDEKNTLYKEFSRQLDIFKPVYFVMENVPGLMSAHNGKYAGIIKHEFRKHGYESATIELNASDFGIAQNRKRIFFIGRRVGRKGGRTEARNELELISKKIEGKAEKNPSSFRRATRGLPRLKAGEGANVIRSAAQSEEGSKPQLIFNHFARKHNSRDLKIYELLSEGEDYADFSKEKREDVLLPYSTDSFKTKFRKIKGNDRCYTIISHLSKDANSYIHPDDDRGITVREAAKVQSFPDDFIFLPKGFSQFITLGNAVPPRLAEAIGKSIIEVGSKRINKCPRNLKRAL